MKRNLFLFTGFGFLGLNLVKTLKGKFNINIFGKKVKYPFKIELPVNKINFVRCNFLNIRKISNYNYNNSTIIITTSPSIRKPFLKEYEKFIKFLITNKPEKIILISSVSVYGNKFPKVSILNSYAKNCLKVEAICKKYIQNLTILRAANIFGTMRVHPGLIEKFSLHHLNVKKFKLLKKDTVRSYIPIDEFCFILQSFLNLKLRKGTYNISNSSYIFDVKKIIHLYETYYKKKIELKRVDAKPSILNSKINPSKCLSSLKYPKTQSFLKEIAELDKFYKRFLIKKKICKL